MERACTYCNSDIDRHDPVFISEGAPDADPTGQFCNYACLATHIEENGLTDGAACEWP